MPREPCGRKDTADGGVCFLFVFCRVVYYFCRNHWQKPDTMNTQPDSINAELNDFLEGVCVEFQRARSKFPDSTGSMCALTEEVFKLAKALMGESSKRVSQEAAQVAVMAARVAIEGDSSLDHIRAKNNQDMHPQPIGSNATPYSGVDIIAKERARQIVRFAADHDLQWQKSEMALAAAYYALTEDHKSELDTSIGNDMHLLLWPWQLSDLRLEDDRVHQLAKAGALIAAEIDRLIAQSKQQ